MIFSFLTSKKQMEQNIFTVIDQKYNCEKIIEWIQSTLNLKIDIKSVVFDSEHRCVLIRYVQGDNNYYLITINEPALIDQRKEYGYIFANGIGAYEQNVTINRGSGSYIDYVFSGEMKRENDKYIYVLKHGIPSERYVNGDVTVISKRAYNISSPIIYKLEKDHKKVHITSYGTDWRIDSLLQNLHEIDLIDLYNRIKEINKQMVLNISIEIIDDQTDFKEKIIIENGVMVVYYKQYIENNVLITLEYSDGKLIKTTKLIEESLCNLQSNDEDIEKAAVRIKTLRIISSVTRNTM